MEDGLCCGILLQEAVCCGWWRRRSRIFIENPPTAIVPVASALLALFLAPRLLPVETALYELEFLLHRLAETNIGAGPDLDHRVLALMLVVVSFQHPRPLDVAVAVALVVAHALDGHHVPRGLVSIEEDLAEVRVS